MNRAFKLHHVPEEDETDPLLLHLPATPPNPKPPSNPFRILAVSSPYISQDGQEHRRCYFSIESTAKLSDDGDPVPEMPEPAVSYIPSQLHTPGGSDPVMLRQPPLRILIDEIKLVLKEMPYFIYIFAGATKKDEGELKLNRRSNVKSLASHVGIFIYSVLVVIIGGILGLVLPTWLLIIFYALMGGLLYLLCKTLNYGQRILHSQVDLDGYDIRPDERWLFVNGICAGTGWLQDNIDSIATVFGRPVTGIHNVTYGVLGDLVECLIQRDLLYSTEDIRLTYNYMKTTLLDPNVKRVVVLAHSQGGIIVSSVIDALYADLMPEAFDKLEIYTFGCAASRFCNPPRPLTPSEAGLEIDPNKKVVSYPRQIGVIEHYVNELDYVARIGVLHYVRGKPKNQYVGRVFTRLNVGGHLFNQHYLQNMFAGENPEFLDSVVRVDESIAIERATVDDAELGAVRGAQQAHEAIGKTVKNLSRLWMYKGGGVPPPDKLIQHHSRPDSGHGEEQESSSFSKVSGSSE